jgi:hypothetical protein
MVDSSTVYYSNSRSNDSNARDVFSLFEACDMVYENHGREGVKIAVGNVIGDELCTVPI